MSDTKPDEPPVIVNLTIDGQTLTEALDRQLAPGPALHTIDAASEIHVRDESKREIVMRVIPWDVLVESRDGPEMWKRGALAHVRAKDVVLRLEHENPAAGRGIELEERDDGAYMAFRVSKTQRGDEILEYAKDGVTRGVSPGYLDVPDGTEMQLRSGRRTRVVRKANLLEVSTTWRPTWEQSAVLAVRSQSQGEPVTEPITTPAAPDISDKLAAVLDGFAERTTKANDEQMTRFADQIKDLQERNRQQIIIPGRGPEPKKATLAEWASVAIRSLKGVPVSQRELQERALDDIIVTENPGLVPHAFVNELIGQINEGRPFLNSTRKITAPSTGMSIDVPVLVTRPTAGVQATEKTEIESTAMTTVLRSFPGVTIAGGADVSIQMLRRADPSFSDLLTSELNEAYARNADSRALATLFAAGTTPGAGNIDPENLLIGEAWTNSITNSGRPPDTMWLSAAGVADFINAKNDGTNAPLYFNLNANFTVGGGPGGAVSALRPVYVPAMDGTSVDVMIGPSSAFAWAEDGTFELSVDNPALAGRDIAVVGIIFFIPRYPAAFTTYDLGS